MRCAFMHVHSDFQGLMSLYLHILLAEATDAVGERQSPINFRLRRIATGYWKPSRDYRSQLSVDELR